MNGNGNVGWQRWILNGLLGLAMLLLGAGIADIRASINEIKSKHDALYNQFLGARIETEKRMSVVEVELVSLRRDVEHHCDVGGP